jgi:REP element-mobilizing transposase RayT
VINRGNPGTDIFATREARSAFVATLDEACKKVGWVVHAWCLMTNRYHLVITTPDANLSDGMHWLQATFGARLNRFRKEQGHIFKERYKALNVEPGETLGVLCHYIHLSPIREKMIPLDQLAAWERSSLRWLMEPKKRASWYTPGAALAYPTKLADTLAGRRKYKDYLTVLATDEQAQKDFHFNKLSKGWAVGSEEFIKELLGREEKTRIMRAKESKADRELKWKKKSDEVKTKFEAAAKRGQAKSAKRPKGKRTAKPSKLTKAKSKT